MKFHKTQKDILNGNIVQQLLLFTFPFCMGFFLQQVYGFADSIILGRLVGTTALASVGGSATATINVMLNFITGLSNGILVIVAQHYGQGNGEGVSKAVKTGMFISVILGGLLTFLGCLSAKPFLKLLNTPPETIPGSLTYMYFYYASFIPYLIYSVGTCILRATGDTKRPLMFIGAQAIIKILLDLIFAGIFKLGVLGASLATFLTNLICGILVLLLFKLTPDCYQFNIKDLGYDKQSLKHALRIGIPSGIQTAVFSITVVLMQAKVNAFGTIATASLAVFNNVDNLFWAQSNGVGMAVMTIVGQNYGRKQNKRVKDTVRYGSIIEIIICVYMGLINYFLGKYTSTIFTTDKNVITSASSMLALVASGYWTYCFVEVISCACKGVGDMINSMIISIIGICGSRFLYLLCFPMTSPNDVLFAYPLSWTFTSLIYLAYYLFSKKYKQIRTCEGR